MKKLVILGAGSGGTMMANKLRRDLDDEWYITLIDKDNVHSLPARISLCPLRYQ